MDENADPQAGLMDLMKKMYDDGDDEMKRTIAKAWTESQDKRAKGEEMMPWSRRIGSHAFVKRLSNASLLLFESFAIVYELYPVFKCFYAPICLEKNL